MAVLEIKNLKFSYPNSDKIALDGVSFRVEPGEICLVIGKSGSGKSTLLRLLKKEIAPYGKTEGEIKVNCSKIGFINQNVESNIVTDTVTGELAFSMENSGKSNKEIALTIAETASYFNLNTIINERTENLSGGTKQMLSLASVMAVSPELLVLDEPSSQLDPVASEVFINGVLKLNREQGITVIISEHRTDNLFSYVNKVLVLENGQTVFFGTPEETAEFLIHTDNEMKQILPPYTLVLPEHPIEFSKAKQLAENIKIKDESEYTGTEAALTAKNISFAYKKGLPDVFFQLDYRAEKGRIHAVVGANGCGKTTLLKCLSGVLKCYSGRIKAKGKTSYMPQNVQTLFMYDTVSDEVNSDELLRTLRLDRFSARNPFDLSGGEAQRLALAKMLSTGADILLLDEPTKSVDAAFKNEFALMLKSLCRQGKTVIFVTHDLEFAGRYADRVSFLFDGRIIADAPRREFFSGLDIYTTALSRLTGGKAVSVDDTEVAK